MVLMKMSGSFSVFIAAVYPDEKCIYVFICQFEQIIDTNSDILSQQLYQTKSIWSFRRKYTILTKQTVH